MSEDSSFNDDFDKELFGTESFLNQGLRPRNGHIRKSLINCAVDETLARAIFRCIDNSVEASLPPLEHLTIRVRNGAVFSVFQQTPEDVQRLVDMLSCGWSISRDVRDDCGDELVVNSGISSSFIRRWPFHDGSTRSRSVQSVASVFRGNSGLEMQWGGFPLQLDR